MPPPVIASYGAWRSPITADMIVRQAVGLGQPALDGGDIYWTELRPAERGRTVLVRYSEPTGIEEVTPPDYSVRSRVHEYGGGAYAVRDGTVWFCNDADQRIYRQNGGTAATPLTPAGTWRYADLTPDPVRGRLYAIREDHGPDASEPVNELVAVDDTGAVTVLERGADFYTAPRPAPDGARLAWLAWDHPNMPWDGCRLMIAPIGDDGRLAAAQCVAGGADEAIFQPEWSPGGLLHFVSDRSGWWNLYRWDGAKADPLCSVEAEFGLPYWAFNMRTYGFLDEARVVCAVNRHGVTSHALLDTQSGNLHDFSDRFVEVQGLVTNSDCAVFIAGLADEAPAIVRLDPGTGEATELRSSANVAIDSDYVSAGQPVNFESADGRRAHAFFYAPKNKIFSAPDCELPPLIVKSHGGPTGQAGSAFNLKTQYWTSRGFAVLDVNYGGSTGFGRAYRRLLDGQWGVVDMEDCAAGAQWLAAQGLVDSARMAISGGSAGGYTTLCALTFKNVFQAGASHYGIGDLEALARDTHKFESRYLDRLVGRWPEDSDVYRARSPLHHADMLNCPVIFFQGLEDKVVPPEQAEAMVAALRRKGVPVAYLPFPGEGHGFRQADTVKRALEAELYFYGRIFAFDPADRIGPVEIEGLA
jgi:dipeptidyl aminopeptidase/acylaminoacyl peptidase